MSTAHMIRVLDASLLGKGVDTLLQEAPGRPRRTAAAAAATR